jgi:hypothetical protein
VLQAHHPVVKLDCVAQQRDVMPRLTITRFRSGVSSMAISPRPSASLMAVGHSTTAFRLTVWSMRYSPAL